jgi:hypothetical protein
MAGWVEWAMELLYLYYHDILRFRGGKDHRIIEMELSDLTSYQLFKPKLIRRIAKRAT